MDRLDAMIAHEGRASTLYCWRVALHTMKKSSDAEIYTKAAEQVVEHLHRCTTLDDLVHAYSSPDHDLTLLLTILCTRSQVPLRPYRLLAASCALRLRQLIDAAGV